MAACRRARCRDRTSCAEFERWVFEEERVEGRTCDASVRSEEAVVGREDGGGGERGEDSVQRREAVCWRWVDSAEAMMSALERKTWVSGVRMGWSLGGILPVRRAVMRAIGMWRSGGREGAREGRLERVVMRR